MSGVFVIGYGVMRFGTDFLRAFDETFAGLTGAQYMCLLLVPFGLWLLYDSRDRSVAGETGGPAPA
jgi:prolipoprotein diacylglyceryltransferase